ncbi:MAG: TRAP transporter small permease [Desulfobacteraceae bacterium]|nr:TRAP transporter small permease [Desulfobacteraceae bacterium]
MVNQREEQNRGTIRMVDYLLGKLEKTNKWLMVFGVISLFAMMIIDTVNVISSQFGGDLIPSGKTLIEELMTVVVFIGLAYLVFERRHIKTEILSRHFSPRLRFFSNILKYLLTASVSLLIFWMNAKTAIQYLMQNVTNPADVPIPMGPFVAIISISFLNLAITALLFFVKECYSMTVDGLS